MSKVKENLQEKHDTMLFKVLPITLNDLHQSILVNSLIALKTNFYNDNFDNRRLKEEGGDNSRVFNALQHAFYLDWYFHNIEQCYQAYSLLEDEISRRLYLHLIAYRIGGHFSVKIPAGFLAEQEKIEAYRKLEKSSPSQLQVSGLLGVLNHFDLIFENKRYKIDCLGLEYCLARRQYFFSRELVCIAPNDGDYVIDGGACFGETALVFSNAVGDRGRVYAFEPVHEHLEILRFNIEQFPLKNVVLHESGLADQDVFAPPMKLEKYDPAFNVVNKTVPLRTIDSLVEKGEIEKIDFIKLDVEGAELTAIQGGMKSIAKFKPKMAISLYHKPNDLFEIIIFLEQNFPFYKFYIEHYTIDFGETVLYCNPSVLDTTD
jgi:FkbM family methyltransferase